MEEDLKAFLKKKVAHLPDLPGVYLLKNEQGEIIYCGKAVSLKKRVVSYFRHNSHGDPRKGMLSAQVRDFEFIVTGSELEALILESTLIKKHKPRFNILLRDDKNYPHICLTLNEQFPRLRVVRRVKKDKCLYFGPFIPVKAMRQTLRLIQQIFQIRRCTTGFKVRKRPCLNHQMGLCCAPCAGLITPVEYNRLIQQIILFLQGNKDGLLKRLKGEMEGAAHAEKYEQAALLRDQIEAIESFMEKQHVFSHSSDDQDCFAFSREMDRACVEVFFVRLGKVTGKKSFQLSGIKDISDSEMMGTVLKQFYGADKTAPPMILVQVMPDEADLIHHWLSEKRGAMVRIYVPQKGEKKALLLIAQKNAALGLHTVSIDEPYPVEGLLKQVQEHLHLPRLPSRIEGFDISNLGPHTAVGSMVFWQDGIPLKSGYRRFKIKEVVGIDDYEMMAEVIKRRYTRLREENSTLPDLILIDGGKGHLQAGINALEGLGIKEIPVVSLAKREELIFLQGADSPLGLPPQSPTRKLLQRIRDEAHRFAISYLRTRKRKESFSSLLDTIAGIGPKRKEMILLHFNSLESITKASLAEIVSVRGINQSTAKKIYEHFHGN